MDMDEIAELAEMLGRLRDADHDFRVFGAKQHHYQLGPPLSEAELVTFEAANQIRLPDAYRQFLSTVGHGGAGPFYGLEPLGTFGRDLSRPFPFTTTTENLPLDQLEPGVLSLCHQGCAIYFYLVVTGPTYGTIWEGREDYDPTGLTFDVWYRSWLERVLRVLENERLIPRLRVGMSRADVLAEVSGDWQARPALGRPVRYFEAADIPAQLELDERDIVVKVDPWPFII